MGSKTEPEVGHQTRPEYLKSCYYQEGQWYSRGLRLQANREWLLRQLELAETRLFDDKTDLESKKRALASAQGKYNHAAERHSESQDAVDVIKLALQELLVVQE